MVDVPNYHQTPPDKKVEADQVITDIRKAILKVAKGCELLTDEKDLLIHKGELYQYPEKLISCIMDKLINANFDNTTGAFMARKYIVLYLPENSQTRGTVGAIAADALITTHKIKR